MPLKSTRVKNNRGAKENICITPTSKTQVTTSVAGCRPRRICRLPSKFEDHSTSPSKYIPLQPIQASTPKIQSKGLTVPTNKTELTVKSKNKADTNNNAKDSTPGKHLCKKSPCKNLNNKVSKGRLINKEYSFIMLEDNKKPAKRDASNMDVYEFTYDPTEEPPPQKKKRKRQVRKKQEKQGPVFTNNYNKNVAKSLAALKSALSAKNLKGDTQPKRAVKGKNCITSVKNNELNTKNKIPVSTKKIEQQLPDNEQNITQKNYNSFRVEDIIVNDESMCNAEKEINYSPVNSPYNVRLPSESRDHFENVQKNNNDPLNLQDDLSFFDENPAASSSMNISTRNPNATPWRVEFGQLPIKWQANTYVKSNMTPAFESSFLVPGDKKKHVYTNIVHEENENLPEIVESDNTPKLRQTSIISFIKEVAEKNAKKKLQSTPVKRNTIFEEIQNISHNLDMTPQKQITTRSPRKSVTPIKNKSSGNITSSTDNMSVSDKENSGKKNKKDENITYFGFDESEEIDQENIIPNNKTDKHRKRALRPRSRAILQELNRKDPPTIPLSVRRNVNKNETKNLNDMWNDLTGKDVQSSPEKVNHINSETVNKINDVVITNENNLTQDDSQSVHLFEDLEVVHRVKPPRKSYVKREKKRVAFRQNSISSDSQDSDVADKDESCAVEDDLHDLTFQVQAMESKKNKTKKRSKKVLSKKEEKEVEAWAAGFNSMCEDVDEFDLVIE